MSTPPIPSIDCVSVHLPREQIREVLVAFAKLDAVKKAQYGDVSAKPKRRKVVTQKCIFTRKIQSSKESVLDRVELVQFGFGRVVNGCVREFEQR